MALVKFVIPPDSSSYAVSDGVEVASIKLDGGSSRYRKDILGATSTVDVSWVMGEVEYKYLRSFFRGITGKGATPFLIDLILDEDFLTEHKVYFIPNSMQLSAQSGRTFWVSAQLEVTPNEDTDNGDFAYLYNELGKDIFVIEDILQVIVNEEWPEVL